MKRFWVLTLLLAGMLLIGAAACGGDDDDDTGDDTGATVTAEADDDDSSDDADDSSDDTGDDDTEGDDDDSGGGDDDYYNQLADILNQADRDTVAVAEQYGGPYDDDADEIEQTRTAFNETGRIIETAMLALADLDPPAEAEAAHENYTATVQDLLQSFAALSADLEDISTGAELDDLEDEYGPDLQTISDQQELDCIALQEIANAAGSGADLGCSTQQ